ncbi:radical SAM protein [Vibrio alginolyticus]|nr:radical SAM protein [Vibrio alginolyticus]
MYIFNKVQIILKVSERCNLNCSYCYYFNGYEEGHIDKPPSISMNVIEKLTKDIIEMIDYGNTIKSLDIFIHGGEPTLIKHEKLDSIIDYLQSNLSERTNVSFFMQTNGTLISSSIVSLINKHKISVGISIDGNELTHDKFRIYRSGKGSFKDVKAGILKLKNNLNEDVPRIGILAVATKPESMIETYNLIVKDLEIDNISFLFPEKNHDDLTGKVEISEVPISRGLINCFDVWKNNTNVNYRNVLELTKFFKEVNVSNIEKTNQLECNFIQSRLLMVRSDGELYHYDRFLPQDANKIITGGENEVKNIFDLKLFDYLTSSSFKYIDSLYKNLPNECSDCLYKNVCRGGNLENRFSKMASFDKKSIYCEDIKMFYNHICSELINAGYPESKINEKLIGNLVVK